MTAQETLTLILQRVKMRVLDPEQRRRTMDDGAPQVAERTGVPTGEVCFLHYLADEVCRATSTVMEAAGVLAQVNYQHPVDTRPHPIQRVAQGVHIGLSRHARKALEAFELDEVAELSRLAKSVTDNLDGTNPELIAHTALATEAYDYLHEELERQMGEEAYEQWLDDLIAENDVLDIDTANENTFRRLVAALNL